MFFVVTFQFFHSVFISTYSTQNLNTTYCKVDLVSKKLAETWLQPDCIHQQLAHIDSHCNCSNRFHHRNFQIEISTKFVKGVPVGFQGSGLFTAWSNSNKNGEYIYVHSISSLVAVRFGSVTFLILLQYPELHIFLLEIQ